MDEISRELPIDATTGNEDAMRHRGAKGPEELVGLERGLVDGDLVVNPASGAGPAADGGASPASRFRLPVAALPALDGAVAEPPPEAGPVEAAPAADPAPGAESASCEATAAAAEPAAVDSPAVDSPAVDSPAVQPAAVEAPAVDAANEAEIAEVAELEAMDAAGDPDLPPVPELADVPAVARVVFVLMLTSREGLSLFRLAQACNTTQKLVNQALEHLQETLRAAGLPVELARAGDTVKWVSRAEVFPYLQRLRGVKKLEKLSPAALETLAVIAYRQPVIRGQIEAIRGVKAGPMLRTLLQHKLIQSKGRADVPGRPLQYGTTQQFLERFGIASLDELPSIKEWKSLG